MDRVVSFLGIAPPAWAGLLGLTLCVEPAHADIPDLSWGPIEVVDTGVGTVSSPAGASVLFAEDLWHVVYEKDGDVLHAARADTGWLAPEPLTADPWISRQPHLAFGDGLHVVWEDDRLGHPEVWTRRSDTGGWSAEECLTCDLAPSRDPVIASNGFQLFAAWQEESLGVQQIRGRPFDGTWGPVEILSLGPADATAPTLAGVFGSFFAAWIDARDGGPEIYLRTRSPFQSEWEPEQRLTWLGDCARPSIHAEECCGDLLVPTWLIVFERLAGVPEVYSVSPGSTPSALSAIDGVPSAAPNIGGFSFYVVWFFGGPYPRFFATWTDDAATHELVDVGLGGEILTDQGLSFAAVGATEGDPYGDPNAAVLAAWMEDRQGVPTLLARTGRLPGVAATGEPTPVGALRLAVSPNPCRSEAVVRLRVPERARASLAILDGAGRSVRDWPAREVGPGEWTVRWDGRDAAGRPARPGLYFAVARLGSTRATRTFVVLR